VDCVLWRKNCVQVTCSIANEKAVFQNNRNSNLKGVNPRGRAEEMQKEDGYMGK
jgi:hypothetical protein